MPYIAERYDSWKFRCVLRRAEMQEALFGINEGTPECVPDRDVELDETKCLKEDQDAELERQTLERPVLGNLMRRFFEMDLSVSSRSKMGGARCCDWHRRPCRWSGLG